MTAPTYDLTAAKDFPQPAETPSWQLVVPEPTALLAVNSDKIKVRPADGAESTDIPMRSGPTMPRSCCRRS